MRYTDVTLAPDDIEWSPRKDHEALKDAIHDDDLFALFVITHGVAEGLNVMTAFHREIANQLIVRGVDEYNPRGWVGRTMRLCRAAKARRNQLRGMLRAEIGWKAAAEVIEAARLRNPRAEWGSAATP